MHGCTTKLLGPITKTEICNTYLIIADTISLSGPLPSVLQYALFLTRAPAWLSECAQVNVQSQI